MHLVIVHGNGLVAMLNKIADIKKNFDPLSITQLSAKQKSWDLISQEDLAPSLFSTKRLVIVEDIDDKIATENIFGDDDLTLVLKFNKPLSAASAVLKYASEAKAVVSLLTEKDETLIFPFLDKLAEKDPHSLKDFENLYETYGGQYLLTMIYYLLRRLTITGKPTPYFVIQKNARQKQNFNQQKIIEIYKLTLETDFKIKSGLLEEKIGLTLLISQILST